MPRTEYEANESLSYSSSYAARRADAAQAREDRATDAYLAAIAAEREIAERVAAERRIRRFSFA